MVVDIGPAQGGSTISLGLAAKDSRRKGKIYSIDVFQKSAALKSYDNVEENVVNLYENVEHYGLKDFVEVRVVGRDDTMLTKETEPVSVLFIDADGAIDRDFEAFYNRLLPGAGIIIDDCENLINLQAKTRFLKWQTKMQEECFLKSLGLSDLESYTPLGKQYTTYQFVSYLKKNGYIEETKNMNGTIFARKPAAAPVFNENTKKEMKKIRQVIVEEFEIRHKKMLEIYKEIALSGIQIARQSGVKDIFLFENYEYTLKQRMQTVKVYEWHENQEDFLSDDLVLQDVRADVISEILEPLSRKEWYVNSTDAIKDESVRACFKNNGIEAITAVPVFIGPKFWGFAACLSKNEILSLTEEQKEEIEKLTKEMALVIKKQQDAILALTVLES